MIHPGVWPGVHAFHHRSSLPGLRKPRAMKGSGPLTSVPQLSGELSLTLNKGSVGLG